MFPNRAAQAYTRIGAETGVAAADPHRLILMLYDGALAALAEARNHLAHGDIAQKGKSLTRAIAIIDEGLRGSLDANGGEIAGHLADLYDYMNRRLLLASLRNDVAGFDEVAALLRELRGAWAGIDAAAARKPQDG
jgi:flagellar protein FliS